MSSPKASQAAGFSQLSPASIGSQLSSEDPLSVVAEDEEVPTHADFTAANKTPSPQWHRATPDSQSSPPGSSQGGEPKRFKRSPDNEVQEYARLEALASALPGSWATPQMIYDSETGQQSMLVRTTKTSGGNHIAVRVLEDTQKETPVIESPPPTIFDRVREELSRGRSRDRHKFDDIPDSHSDSNSESSSGIRNDSVSQPDEAEASAERFDYEEAWVSSMLCRATGCYALDGKECTVGSDCSGACAWYFAMQGIIRILKMQNVEFKVKFRFGSEKTGKEAAGQRLFLTLNCNPDMLFGDMLRRSKKSGPELYTGTNQPLVAVDMYIAGFVCTDLSSANSVHPKDLDFDLTDESGDSSKTLHASLAYIAEWQPKVVILENVYKKRLIAIVHGLIKEKLGSNYTAISFVVNTRDFGLDHSRLRVYFVCVQVRKAEIRVPLLEWPDLLEDIAFQLPKLPWSEILVPADSPEVSKYLTEDLAQNPVDECGEPMWTDAMMKHGYSWEKNFRLPGVLLTLCNILI